MQHSWQFGGHLLRAGVMDQTDGQNFWSKDLQVKKHKVMPGNSRKPLKISNTWIINSSACTV